MELKTPGGPERRRYLPAPIEVMRAEVEWHDKLVALGIRQEPEQGNMIYDRGLAWSMIKEFKEILKEIDSK